MTYQIISERRLRRKIEISVPNAVYKLVKPYAKAKQEYFILLTLDNAHCVISVSIISIGLVNQAIVHSREVFVRAINDRASAIIICHNHPSGSVIPSDEDKEVTKSIYKAGEIIGIPLLDHVVFSNKAFTSFKQQGFFPKTKKKLLRKNSFRFSFIYAAYYSGSFYVRRYTNARNT
jgi:DNA repair protein RadC